jgi:hypothetical protein
MVNPGLIFRVSAIVEVATGLALEVVMQRKYIVRFGILTFVVALALSPASHTQTDPAPEAQTKLAALKQSIQASAAALRQYEWVETLVVSKGGEEKSRKQNRCYYGADGGVQKKPITQSDQGSGGRRKPRGVRKRVVANKTEDLKEYIQQAMALVKQYVPPDAQKIQAAKDAGKTTLSIHDNATRMRLEIPNYIKAGDALRVDIDPNNDRLLGISVSTYLNGQDDVAALEVKLGTLNDGTSYPAEIVFDGVSKSIRIVVTNTGYRISGS